MLNIKKFIQNNKFRSADLDIALSDREGYLSPSIIHLHNNDNYI